MFLYNPGITDISGQLIGQGIGQFGEGAGQLAGALKKKLEGEDNDQAAYDAATPKSGGPHPIMPPDQWNAASPAERATAIRQWNYRRALPGAY